MTRLLIALLLAAQCWGAAFTSKANGNWTAAGQTTWNEAGTPGTGDTVTISHAVTCPAGASITVGNSTPGTFSVTIANAGSLINNCTLFHLDGDLDWAGTLTLGPDSVFEFGNAGYTWKSTTGWGGTTPNTIQSSGTSAAHPFVVRTVSGGTNVVMSTLGRSPTHITLAYGTFLRIGSASSPLALIGAGDGGTSSIYNFLASFDHITFDATGYLNVGGYLAAQGWRITNCVWKNSLADYPLEMNGSASPTEQRLIDSSVFDKQAWINGNGSKYTRNVFMAGMTYQSSTQSWAQFGEATPGDGYGNFIHIPIGSSSYLQGSTVGNYILVNSLAAPTQTGTATSAANSTSTATLTDSTKSWTASSGEGTGYASDAVGHGWMAVITGGTGAGQIRQITSNTSTTLTVLYPWATLPNGTSTYAIVMGMTNPHALSGYVAGGNPAELSYNVAEFTGADENGELFYPLDASGGTYSLHHNLLLPGGSRGSPFTLVTGTPSLRPVSVEHNTVWAGAQSPVQLEEAGSNAPGTVTSFKSNLTVAEQVALGGWGPYHITTVGNFGNVSAATQNIVAPANVTNNGRWGLNAGYAGGGYNINLSGTPDAGTGVNADPQFVDSTRNFAKWAYTKGYSSSASPLQRVTDGFAALQADSTRITDLITWVRAGFAPTNAAYHNTAHDGTDIGAVPFQATSATYNVGPGKTYTTIGAMPWTSLAPGDVVNIYPQTAITGTTASSSTGTTITLTGSAASIPYGSSVWFSGFTGTKTWVTCGVYGSGLYGTATGGTACAGSSVTVADAVTVGSGVTVYFTPPYFEKIILTTAGTIGSPIIVQGVADPVTGALPILDAHNATTGTNMAHTGSTSQHDAYGFLVFLKSSDGLAWPKYLTLKNLRIQSARGGLTSFDATNASYTYVSGVGGIRLENSDSVTLEALEVINCENGIFAKTAPGNNPASLNNALTVRGNHFYRNGSSSFYHQTYIEVNGVIYEQNWYDQPALASSCSQLKDRSAGTVIRYNKFYPAGRVLDLINSQDGYTVLIPGKSLTVPAGGFASGATSLTFTTSVAGISAGDRVGFPDDAGWSYGNSADNSGAMPTVTGVDTGTNTLTLAAPGLPSAVAAGKGLYVVYRAPSPYTQTFVYGNVFDLDQTIYLAQPGAFIHYGWDTAWGIDSAKDRAGTLYFYNNTVITRWDLTGSTGASYGITLIQVESNADQVRLDNNLIYATNANVGNSAAYMILAGRAAYTGGSVVLGAYAAGTNQIAPSGWTPYQDTVAGSTFDLSAISTRTLAQQFPSGLTGTRDYRLQSGSTAIGAASTLPAAISSNTLGLNLTPVYEYGGAARSTHNDLGAFESGTGGTGSTAPANWSGSIKVGGSGRIN